MSSQTHIRWSRGLQYLGVAMLGVAVLGTAVLGVVDGTTVDGAAVDGVAVDGVAVGVAVLQCTSALNSCVLSHARALARAPSKLLLPGTATASCTLEHPTPVRICTRLFPHPTQCASKRAFSHLVQSGSELHVG